jgi:hypothetical protein
MNLAASGNTWGIASLSNKTGTTTTAASPYVRADGVPAVLYLSTDNHLREAELFPTGWSVTDLTAVTGAPAPLNQGPAGRAGVIPNGYVRSDGLNTVVYTTPGFHIIELALSGTTWGFNDITDAAGGGI